ncbi:DUF6934 family protein [Dyadobacter sp. BHUBP1]|uniref:DUF6934 family protein n=1 Tax=Dyadobacter sp. BHUBP1 TaxID=3424178 RepID=UPI003D354FB7
MERPHYEFEYAIPREVYLFVSKGKHGNVTKMVKFQMIRNNIANLGFGDSKDDGFDFDDLVITDNGDMETVLATVIKITVTFLSKNPDVSVYINGSTATRNRLYRVIISNNLETISQNYEVWGYCRGA